MRKRVGWPVVVAAWALLLPAGCGKPAAPSLTVSVGGAPAEVAYWEQLVRDFEAREGIPVTLHRQPTDSDLRRQGLVVALRARQPDPDVFLMDVAWLAQFAASGWLEPLDTPGAGESIDASAFFTRVVDLADRHEGRLVALPVYVDGGLLYYRADLLERGGLEGPPHTWDELVESARVVQAAMRDEGHAKFQGFVWQGAQYEGLMCTFLEFAVSNGGGLAVSPAGVSVDTPENRTALRFMRDLIHDAKVSPPNTYTTMKEEEVRMAFQRGDALYERNWPYAWALHQADDSPVRGKVGIAPLPRFPGGKSAATLGGWHVGISAHADAKADSRKFVRFVTSYDTQKAVALQLGWNPGRRDVYDDPEVLAALPHFGELRAVFEHAYPRPQTPYYTQLSEVLQRYLNAALADEMPVDEALAAAEGEAGEIVKRYGS